MEGIRNPGRDFESFGGVGPRGFSTVINDNDSDT